MLSTAAANALLKTLEEPPGHVVFVLATTDPQKVPPTIRSRTQHLEFRLFSADTLHALLESINDAASLGLGEEALEAAVRRGRGSARDALSALDQVVASGSADAARPELTQVVDALASGDVTVVLVSVNTLLAGGWGPQQLATELADDLRQVFLAGLAPDLCASTGAAREPRRRAGRDDGPAAGRAHHGDPRPRPRGHARGARHAGRARSRPRPRRPSGSRFRPGGARRPCAARSSARRPARPRSRDRSRPRRARRRRRREQRPKPSTSVTVRRSEPSAGARTSARTTTRTRRVRRRAREQKPRRRRARRPSRGSRRRGPRRRWTAARCGTRRTLQGKSSTHQRLPRHRVGRVAASSIGTA